MWVTSGIGAFLVATVCTPIACRGSAVHGRSAAPVQALSEGVGMVPRLATVTMDVTRPWLDGLTQSQSLAVTHEGGPLLVLAGPGSGKTRVITRRICHRIAQGVPAWHILALTFTNKAAREMKARVDSLVDEGVPGRRGLVVSTFHSFSAGLLRRYGAESPAAALGGTALRPDFTIFDSDDSHSALKRAMKEIGLERSQWPVAGIASAISEAKNRLLTAADYTESTRDFRERVIAKVYVHYERSLVRQNALDFDDLLLRCARMLRNDPAVRTELQRRFTEVLVDEYQDTNHAQFTVAHAIACEHKTICVVGDPDQSIYAWRGADISNILEFEEHYPGATVIALGENFRSTGHIVALADALIRHNTQRRHKDLSTNLGEGIRPRFARLSEEIAEAKHVVAELERSRDLGVPWKEMAILYRMNALSRNLEDALRQKAIPYVIARGTAFFDRREVRDTLAYLRTIANPLDDTALARIVNVPHRGIGATSMEKLHSLATTRLCSLAEAMAGAHTCGIAKRTVKSIDGLLTVIARFRSELAVKPASNLGAFVARLVAEAGLERAAAALGSDDEDAEDRRANVQEVANAAAQYELPELSPDSPDATLGDALRGFLESVALVADADAIDPERGAVTLMSLHASKGLEYDTVAIVGIEEGLLPHTRAARSPAGLEEERRLLFVGITRCKRALHLTAAASRAMQGLRMSTIASTFLRELPPAHLDELAEEHRIEYDEAPGRRAHPFVVGMTVRSAQFGIGRVESLEGRRALLVRFRTAGVRTLYPEFAKLEIIAPA